MATTTPNLGLRKPENSDTVNVTLDIANNMQIVDDTFNAGTPTTIAPGDTAGGGTALQVARLDHRHGAPSFGSPVAVGTSLGNGVSGNLARSDHVHSLANAFGSPVSVGSALADGTSPAAARSDHVHNLSPGLVTTPPFARSLFW